MPGDQEQRIVVGYHGTSIEAAESILKQGFAISRNDYDWLGDGVYFWEQSKERAWEWARGQYGHNVAVVAARIALVDCMDLLDRRWCRVLTDGYDRFLMQLKRVNLPLPRQTSGAHRLDRAVINYVVAELKEQGMDIRCVRGCFPEGQPVFPDSAILDKMHIQIAVRNRGTCIKEVWLDP